MFNPACDIPPPIDGQNIFPNLFISDWDTSQNLECLKTNNIKAIFSITEHAKKPNILGNI